MPPVKRKTLRTRASYSEDHRRQLLNGFALSSDYGFGFSRDPAEKIAINTAMAEGWDDLRDELLPGFIAAHPLQRPYGWWRFDAMGLEVEDGECEAEALYRGDMLTEDESPLFDELMADPLVFQWKRCPVEERARLNLNDARPLARLADSDLRDRFYFYRGAKANVFSPPARDYGAGALHLVAAEIVKREAWFNFWVDGEVRRTAGGLREANMPASIREHLPANHSTTGSTTPCQ
jgi:hypothetical protein